MIGLVMDRITKEGAFIGLVPKSKVTITLEKKKKEESIADKDGKAKFDFTAIIAKYLREELDVAITHKDYETTNMKIVVRQTKIIMLPLSLTQTKKG
jgi:hypothetical protein